MTTAAPIPLEYQGDGQFVAKSGSVRSRCDKEFVVHEIYPMEVHEERSSASHSHFFAALHEQWENLPDDLALQFASVDDLRKHALILTGWHHERRLAAASKAEARKVAAFMMNGRREYALISVAENVVIERTARSQKTRGPDRMNKADFQKSKQDVLDWIEDLVRISREPPSPSIMPEMPHRIEQREDA